MAVARQRTEDHLMGLRTDQKLDRMGGMTSVRHRDHRLIVAAPGFWVWWPRVMLELAVFGPREMLGRVNTERG
jgi:hypothetical protein